ncbi:metal binding domain of Ada-domain-containing protein [Xylogone sp. PMI_703]|nr:metal binding domain of Ada-domain-containing protein [Xylogone sp. PMI_703]
MSSSNSRVASPSQRFATPSSRWAALQRRDPAAENSFIYSVTTTKIYCRPTCPSRLARRANIVFHDNAAAAEKDGFRPCRRCRPDLSSEDVPQRKAIEKACDLIKGESLQDNEVKKWTVKALAKEVGLTESHFCRSFKRFTGCTIGEYRAQMISTAQNEARIGTTVTDPSSSTADQHLDVSESDDIATENWDLPLEEAANITPFDHSAYIWNNHDEWNQDISMGDWPAADANIFDYSSMPLSLPTEDTPAFDGEHNTSQPD